jgi:tyrosinase
VMGGSRSARDPIFFMHHCNIDRIWALWRAAGNQDTSDPLWRDMQFKDHFFNTDGSIWSPKVSELQDHEALGYTYGLPQEQTLSAPVIALNDRLAVLIAAPRGQAVSNVNTFQATNTAAAAANAPSQFRSRSAPRWLPRPPAGSPVKVPALTCLTSALPANERLP